MSGVVAHLAPGRTPAERVAVRTSMLAAMPHRGSAYVTVEVGDAVLGVVSRGGEPAIAARDGWAVAIAGTIDDGLPELLGAGPDRGDQAAALLRAFIAGRKAVPPRLRGAFAAVVTDGRTLWAWRDQLGFGPLFYRYDSGDTWLASEAKAVVAGAGLPRRADLDVVEAIFYGRYDDSTPTALAGARRLPKATVLTVDADGARTHRYWDPAALVETRPSPARAALQADFDLLMSQAVRRVMRGPDVVSLSGGVDSPAVAAYAADAHRELFGTPLPALSAVYPDQPSVDEKEWIELVAGRFDMPLTTYRPARPRLERLDEWTRLFDGPVPTIWFDEVEDSYRRAAELGHAQILTGEFAEYVVEMREGLVDHLIQHWRWRGAARFLAAKRRGGAGWTTLGRLVAGAAVPEPILRAYRRRRSDFVGLSPADFVDASRLDQESPTLRRGRRQRWRHGQLRGFGGPGLSLEADEAIQEQCGVMVRRPWIDVDLWEYWISLPAEDKFPESRYKGLVKQLLRGRVPDELLDRQTFTVFDADILSKIDYPGLRRWLLSPQWRMPGVDYALLQAHLTAEDLGLEGYIWARDLAAAHAFVDGMDTAA